MDFEELSGFLEASGERAYRAGQIRQAYFKSLVADWSSITSLPSKLRDELARKFAFLPLKPVTVLAAPDKDCFKALLETSDSKQIESVLMIYDDRATVCVSVQIGCPLGCTFCATGQGGFERNLTADEIVEQVLFWQRYMGQHPLTRNRIDNVVFMGMGEPFLNTENVFAAIKQLNDEEGFGLASRRMSISTIGIPEGIGALAAFNDQVNLAVSLHAPRQQQREILMPATKRYALAATMTAVRSYVARTNRKVFFEYTLLRDVNDDRRSAERLADLLQGEKLFHVNLVPYNETGAALAGTGKRGVFAFRELLVKRGIRTTVRKSLGAEIWAACGQLRLPETDGSPRTQL